MITVLKAEKIDLALLEAKYGFVTPQKVLQALQRDTIQGKPEDFQEDIYEKPMIEVKICIHIECHQHKSRWTKNRENFILHHFTVG